MSRIATTALKGAGVLLLAIVLLSAIATIVGLVLSIVATVVSILVTLAVLALFVLAVAGLWSLVRDDTDQATDRPTAAQADDRDPETRLREMYVAGEIDDREFERQLDLLLDSEDTATQLDRLERERDQSPDHRSRPERLRER